MPEKAKELHAMMKKWHEETNSPVPTELNPEYDPDAKPVAKEKKGKGKKR